MIVRELLARLGMDVDKSAFSKAENALARIHLAFAGMKDIVTTVKAGIDDLLEGTANRAFEAKNLSAITGISIERVQELGYAAKVTNVSTEELSHGLVHLARLTQEVANGSAEASAVFYKLGVRATDGNGKLRPLDQLIGDISTKFAGMPDGTQKAALAMELFSRGGARMIQFLDKGPDGLAKLGEQARRAGVVMSNNGVATAMKYREAMLQLSAAIEGVKNAIALKLFPAITKGKEGFTALIISHRKWIAEKAYEGFVFLSHAIQGIFTVVKGIVDLFERIWKSSSIAKGALVTLGIVVAAFAAPWTLVAAAIALVAEDFELFLTSHGKAKTVTGLLVAAFELLRTKAMEIFTSIKESFLENWEELGRKTTFEWLYEKSKIFFKWFEEQAGLLGDRIAKALVSGAGHSFLKVIFGDAPKPSPEALEEMKRTGKSPDQIPTGSNGLYNLIGNLIGIGGPELQRLHLLEQMENQPTGTGPFTVSFGDVIVHTGPGADGQKAGDDFVRQVTPQLNELLDNHWQKKMQETAAAVK